MDFMLCESEKPENLEKYKDRGNWYASRKFDGSRVKITIGGGGISLKTRRGEEISDKFPEFEEIEVSGNYVLDGEVCRFPYTTKIGESNYEPFYHIKKSNEKFNKLLMRTNQENKFKIKLLSDKCPCKIVIFDILEVNGTNLRSTELKNRVAELKKFINKIEKGREHFIRPKQYTNTLELWNKVKDNNLEGLILKDLNSKYRGERSDRWLKVKAWEETELMFDQYEENDNGTITLENGDGIRVLCPRDVDKVKGIIEEEGKVKTEIQYLEKTKGNKYRQPSFKGVIR